MSERTKPEIMESTHDLIIESRTKGYRPLGIAVALNMMAEHNPGVFLRDIHHPEADQTWTAADVEMVLAAEFEANEAIEGQFRKTLWNGDDQVTVRRLLVELVPADVQAEIVRRFQEERAAYAERKRKLKQEQAARQADSN